MHVLVVDDDKLLRACLRGFLQSEGHLVATAANGAEALAWLRRNAPPDVILLDLEMPVMDGWQLCDALQREAAHAAVPIIVVSATADGGPHKPMIVCRLGKPVYEAHLRDAITSCGARVAARPVARAP